MDEHVALLGGGDPFGNRAIRKQSQLHPDSPPEVIAETYVEGLPSSAVHAFAVKCVKDWIEHIRREEARKVETEAHQSAVRAGREANEAARKAQRAIEIAAEKEVRAVRKAKRDKDRKERSQERESRFTAMRDYPEAYIHDMGGPFAAFREWMGEAAFEGWFSENHRRIEGKSKASAAMFTNLYRGGSAMQGFESLLRGFAEDMKDQGRLELTAELLATPFALGDGVRVTWGMATVAQHRQRADMLIKQASGTMETASRHQIAIRMIDEAGVACLAEVEPVALAAD